MPELPEVEALGRLHSAVVAVIRDAVECWATRRGGRDLRNIGRWLVRFEEFVGVSDRRGFPCHRCGRWIEAMRAGGPTSYFCPHCQLGALRGEESYD